MRLNQIIMAILDWPVTQFEKLRDWLEAGSDLHKKTAHPFDKRCYVMSEKHLSGARVIIGFDTTEDADEAHEFLAHHRY